MRQGSDLLRCVQHQLRTADVVPPCLSSDQTAHLLVHHIAPLPGFSCWQSGSALPTFSPFAFRPVFWPACLTLRSRYFTSQKFFCSPLSFHLALNCASYEFFAFSFEPLYEHFACSPSEIVDLGAVSHWSRGISWPPRTAGVFPHFPVTWPTRTSLKFCPRRLAPHARNTQLLFFFQGRTCPRHLVTSLEATMRSITATW